MHSSHSVGHAASPRAALVPSDLRVAALALVAIQLGFTAPAPAANYERAAEPPIRHAFAPLPPGAVEPAGWLRDWCLAARDGITGHLDERSPVYQGGWKGIPLNALNARADGTGWPLEQCGYWLDGLVRLAYVLHDDALVRKAASRLEPIVEGINREKSKSFIYWRKDLLPSGFNSWACSHMGRALVAWYEATGDKRILDALVQAYADYPVPMGQLGYWDVSGLCNIDAMLETYSFSGDRRILDRVRAAFNSPEVDSTLKAWVERRLDACHGVIAYEQFRLPLLLYPWTGESRYRQASLHALQWLNENHLLPDGGASGMETLAGIGPFRLTETCDVEASLWTNLWFYRILGDPSYGDSVERTFFNAGPAPIARDFQTMCYYQSPNRILGEALPEEQPKAPGHGSLKFTPIGHQKILCCIGAVNRILPTYVMHMWMATADDGLAATLYGPCKVSALAGAKLPVKLTCQTAYPFEETVRITVDPDRPAAFPLYFRIPRWCINARLSLNGRLLPVVPDARGYVRLERSWNQGDKIELVFPMSVRIERGYETEYPISARQYFDYKPDEVFRHRRFPCADVVCGPLLFSLPIKDKDPNTPIADAHWQYALDIDAALNGADVVMHRGPMPARWDWPLNAPVWLEAPARPFDWKPTDIQPLPATVVEETTTVGATTPVEGTTAAAEGTTVEGTTTAAEGTTVEGTTTAAEGTTVEETATAAEGTAREMIKLVPYGCTKFRISMFPVTSRAWGTVAP